MGNNDKRKKVVVCGEKWVAEQCLEFLCTRNDTEVCALVAVHDDWQADLVSFGAKRNLKVFAGNINDYVDELAVLSPDFIFSIQYRPLLKRAVLAIPIHGCINLHFGLLPRYGGCYPVAWSILNGEKEAGATLHYMGEKFDEGDIISQAIVPIGTETTARELFDSISKAAVGLFIENYPSLLEGITNSHPQDLSRKLYYTKESINFDIDRIIDWSKSAIEIHRRICAFTFQPFQLPLTTIQIRDGRQLQVSIASSRLFKRKKMRRSRMVGSIRQISDSGKIIVETIGGDLVEIGSLNNQLPRDYLKTLQCSAGDIIFK